MIPVNPVLRIENACTDTVWATYSSVLPEERYDTAGLDRVATAIVPREQRRVEPPLVDGGFVVARVEGGEWIALVPLEGEGNPKGDQYTIDGEACDRLLGAGR